jgi:predicted unusual protein kinase regulating ubiquinone biosynthesis (AarF/ABC1/UbiB family)
MLKLLVNFVNKDAAAMSKDFLNLDFIPHNVAVDAVKDELEKVIEPPPPTTTTTITV